MATATMSDSNRAIRNVFHDMPASLVKKLESLEFTTNYPPNAVLFREGQPPRGIFVIVRGLAKLSVSSREGKTLILRMVGPGGMIGISASVSGGEYEATAETLEACEVSFLRRSDVLRLMQRHNELALWLAQNVSNEYSCTCREVRNLFLADSASGKLARLLVERLDSSSEQPGRLKLGLTHEDMAQMIGTSRETVSRTLADFKKRRLIEQIGATLIIHNRMALESMVAA
jgi:CRP/FNR family transcriptional regulator, cyclic AMP receptor protein